MTDDSPLPIKFSRKVVNLKYPRLFLLVETNCLKNLNFHNVHYYNLSQFGIPRAWRADENLGLLIESDIDHFTKLSSLFLACPIFVDLGFEINRIQSKKFFSLFDLPE